LCERLIQFPALSTAGKQKPTRSPLLVSENLFKSSIGQAFLQRLGDLSLRVEMTTYAKDLYGCFDWDSQAGFGGGCKWASEF